MDNDHYVTLMSNASPNEFPSNTSSKFRNKLFTPLRLEGEWKVGLLDLSLGINCENVEDQVIGFKVPVLESSSTTSPPAKVRQRSESFTSTNDRLSSSPIDQALDENFDDSTDVTETKSEHYTYKYGVLRGGYYSSVRELLSQIVKLYKQLFKVEITSNRLLLDLVMLYDNVHDRASYYAHSLQKQEITNQILITSLHSSFFNSYLGVQPDEYSSGTFSLQVKQFPQSSQRSSSLTSYKKLYVCSDIMNEQFVGSGCYPLLTTVSIEDQHVILKTPWYHKVNKSYIESIEVQIFSCIESSHEPKSSTPSECTLHFKKCSLLNSCI
jgi:hypothetical protein